MPIFEYRCVRCNTTYDIFHHGREAADDIVCPACTSRDYTKLISAPSISVREGSSPPPPAPACGGGGCCGGGACEFD